MFFGFEKEFSLICSSEHLFQFRQTWRNIFATVPWTYFPAPSPDKIETMCKDLIYFFLKVFQGYVGYSFDNSGEFFRQIKIKFSFRIFKKLVIFFLFETGFF